MLLAEYRPLGETPSGSIWSALDTGDKVTGIGGIAAGLLAVGSALSSHKDLARHASWATMAAGFGSLGLAGWLSGSNAGKPDGTAGLNKQIGDQTVFMDILFGGTSIALGTLAMFLAGRK